NKANPLNREPHHQNKRSNQQNRPQNSGFSFPHQPGQLEKQYTPLTLNTNSKHRDPYHLLQDRAELPRAPVKTTPYSGRFFR
ncbi:hypothetical protein, partial [Arthrobacter sp. BF1]|uniref:hypothetical protein n=1 Tax=Arthrobacter sp. BF1 TaxID=2821145 RepID=UPI001C50132D